MGVSGACYRLAFCSPGWDYSSVDGLVAYDYATPAFKAFGYIEERHGRIAIVEKAERIHKMLDSGEYLEGARSRQFWTVEKRLTQADFLAQMLEAEREAVVFAEKII